MAKFAVHATRWGVGIFLIFHALNYIFAKMEYTFRTAEEMQWYMVTGMLWLICIPAWFLLTLYLFPDSTCREDSLSRWLASKGLSWHV